MRKSEKKKRWEAWETCAFAGSEGAKRRVARESARGMNRGWQAERLRRRRRRRWSERVNLLLYFSPFVSTLLVSEFRSARIRTKGRETDGGRKGDSELCDFKSWKRRRCAFTRGLDWKAILCKQLGTYQIWDASAAMRRRTCLMYRKFMAGFSIFSLFFFQVRPFFCRVENNFKQLTFAKFYDLELNKLYFGDTLN